MTNSNGRGISGSRWSPELLTVLGSVLAVGVALATLTFTGLDHVRTDMIAMEERLREDMQTMQGRLREDIREFRGDAVQLRDRVSNREGLLTEGSVSPTAL